jgi:hypothetical protein
MRAAPPPFLTSISTAAKVRTYQICNC